jgi:hypothetical protein
VADGRMRGAERRFSGAGGARKELVWCEPAGFSEIGKSGRGKSSVVEEDHSPFCVDQKNTAGQGVRIPVNRLIASASR